MASADTVYRVITEYGVRDQASKGAKKIGNELDIATKKGIGLRGVLGSLGLAFGGRAVFGLAKSTLIDFNSEMEQAKIQTAALLKINTGVDFSKGLKQATGLVGELQERAAKSTATTAEMVDFMSRIAGPATKAGLAVKDMAEFTSQAVVAAKLFGEEATAGLDIKQALTKGVEVRDRFANVLLDIAKIDRDAFNKLAAGDRLKILQKSLRDPAISQAAESQAGSFAGLFSTLKDNLQIALGKVGLPLMRELSKAAKELVASFNDPAMAAKIEQFGKDFGQSLVTGFKIIKEAIGFLVRNRELLMTLAKAALVGKVAGRLGGLVAGAGKHLGPSVAALGKFVSALDMGGGKFMLFGTRMELLGNTMAKKVIPQLANMGKNVAKVAGGLGLLYVGARMAADAIDRAQSDQIDRDVEAESLRDRVKQAREMTGGSGAVRNLNLLKDLRRMGIVKDGEVDRVALAELKGGPLAAMDRDANEFAHEIAEAVKEVMVRGELEEKRVQEVQALDRVTTGAKSLAIGLTEGTWVQRKLRDAVETQTREMLASMIPALKMLAEGGIAKQFKNVGEFFGGGLKRLNRQPVNVKIEIPARDPGLFARQFNTAMERVVARPTAASTILGGSF